MKLRDTLLALFCGGICLSASAVEPIVESFTSMPSTLIPTVEKNRRLDLIDLFRANQTATVANLLGGSSTLTCLQDSLLTLDLSSQSRVSIRLLTDNKGEALHILVRTACAPACDSHVEFYTADWKELPAEKYIRAIDLTEFLQFPDTLSPAEQEELRQLVNIRLLEYSFTPVGYLQITPSWEEYLDTERFKRIAPYLRDSVILRWNGKRFE